jgi:hypothetical protein
MVTSALATAAARGWVVRILIGWCVALAAAGCSGPVPPDPCLGLPEPECRADASCAAVPYWGESPVPCEIDARGFSTDCPWVACRSAAMNCPSLAELTEACPLDCPEGSYALDPETGCRICRCPPTRAARATED